LKKIMWLDTQKERIQGVYREYPRPFWTLVAITFIDRIGGALLYPFFALYITVKFDVGMTQVGVLFAIFSVSSFFGQFIGGALADRMGRKRIMIFSLIATSFSSVLMGLVSSLSTFYVLALFVGILTEAGGPARQAMVADLLPEKKRAQGYGIMRVAFNLSVTIGPALGGLLVRNSYLFLFIADAVISSISAILVWVAMPETKPEAAPNAEVETMVTTFQGYGTVLRDRMFMLFLSAAILVGFVYMNMNTTLGVYLRDHHGIDEAGYGLLLSLNAAMVVFLQFPITRRIEKYTPMLMMALGAALYAIGFGMYGFVSSAAMFVLAMVILTIGEMVISPVAQALVATFAPEDKRGRYMAIFGFSFGIPYAIGPYFAGLILDNADPHYLWYLAGFVGILATMMYLWLHREVRSEGSLQPQQAAD
jgi:MFS family permease